MNYFQGKLFVGIAGAGATYNNAILVNYLQLPVDEEAQFPWTLWTGLNPSDFAIYQDSGTALPILTMGSAHAQSVALQLETGNSDYDYSAATQTVAINSYYNTKVFSLPGQYRRQYLTYKTQSTTSYLRTDTYVDFQNTSFSEDLAMQITGAGVYGTGVYGTATYGGQNAIIAKTNVALRGKFIQFKFSNAVAAQPWTVYRLQQVYNPIPLR
jgi:hypothetical protein